MYTDLTKRALTMLTTWSDAAEKYWYDIPGTNGHGCYGTGYNGWGVQTNQKYLSSMAVLSSRGAAAGISDDVCTRAGERALAALRFSLASHKSGNGRCTDGAQWGHTWISALGIERMMHGVRLLDPLMTGEDRAAVRAMLVSESDWLLENHPVVGDPDGASGHNHPESNLWNGAVLWRTAQTCPDNHRAAAWTERAHEFLINSVSIAADAGDDTVVAGKTVRERHCGANFQPNFALDHHVYFNTGYMVICHSNAAILHFDLKATGTEAPESLYHHQQDLWNVVRRFIAPDGRLLRAGGDSRVRYAYCQDYLMPSMLLAADALGEQYAATLLEGQLGLIQKEMDYSSDGSFYGRRIAELKKHSQYYYTRLESDRACVLGMLAAYAPLTAEPAPATETFEASVNGVWTDPGYGAALVRSERRYASFTWQAQSRTQGMCLPPARSESAEWEYNLSGYVRFRNDNPMEPIGHKRERSLLGQRTESFDGGFITSGTVGEGVDAMLLEGWRAPSAQAMHQMVYCALPDDRTVIGMQYCVTGAFRTYPEEVRGFHLNLPHDVYNKDTLQLLTESGSIEMGPVDTAGSIPTGSSMLVQDGVFGAVGMYGADGFVIDRSTERRGGKYRSLHTEQVCWPLMPCADAVDPGTVLLDSGWAVLSGAGADETRAFAASVHVLSSGDDASVRIIRCTGADGKEYLVAVNFNEDVQEVTLLPIADGSRLIDLVAGTDIKISDGVVLEAGMAQVFVVE